MKSPRRTTSSLLGLFLMMDARFSKNMSFVSGVVDSVGAYTLIRVTGPVVEVRQRVRRRSPPPLLGSTIFSKLPLTQILLRASWALKSPSPAGRICSSSLSGYRVCNSCFQESSNVHVQSSQIIVNDCLPRVLDVLQVCRKISHHRPDVPISQFYNWSLMMISVCSCLVPWLQSVFRVVPYPHAPNEDGRPWWDSTLLAGRCPAWGGR